MADLFVVITKNGTVSEKRVYSGETENVPADLVRERQATPGLAFLIFASEVDPGFKDAKLPASFPAVQDQLVAVFTGGQAFEDMKVKVLASVPSQVVLPI